MPLCVLLWILVLLPALMLAWYLFAELTSMDGDVAVQGLMLLSLALILATPNLLWYQSVRDAMVPPNAPPATLTNETPSVEAVSVDTMTIPAATTMLMPQ